MTKKKVSQYAKLKTPIPYWLKEGVELMWFIDIIKISVPKDSLNTNEGLIGLNIEQLAIRWNTNKDSVSNFLSKLSKCDIIDLCGNNDLCNDVQTSVVISPESERTARFIKRYLVPKKKHPIKNPQVSFRKLVNYHGVSWSEVKAYIFANLNYEDFLHTLYWCVISSYVKFTSNKKCKVCGKDKDLHVHHMTYKNHGDEAHHLEDLVCLCAECHQKEHPNKTILKQV